MMIAILVAWLLGLALFAAVRIYVTRPPKRLELLDSRGNVLATVPTSQRGPVQVEGPLAMMGVVSARVVGK